MNKLIEQLGWIDQNDRGMSENYGYLFKLGDWELQYWRPHPRISLTRDGIVEFDSGIITEGIGIDDIKQVMNKFKIPML